MTLGLAVSASAVFGQNAERNAPKVPKPAAVAGSLAAPALAVDSAAGDTTIVPELKGVVIVDKPKTINPAGAKGVTGLKVGGPDFLLDREFAGVVVPYLGKPFTNRKLTELQRDIIVFCRKKDHPVVDVLFEEQEIVDGVIQITVLDGKLGKVAIRNEGEQWFKDKFILSNIRLHEGDSLVESKLVEDINWLNRNPFREVDIKLRQGEVGRVDLDVEVRDQRPFRPYLGYEDSLTRILGDHLFFVGFNWGNAFGWDHQLNYQFSTDIGFQHIRSHSGSYVIPLPWRHTVTIFGSYTDVNPDISKLGFPGVTQKGSSYQTSLRYTVPLPKLWKIEHDIAVGADFKRSDNNLEFGGTNVFSRPAEIVQFNAGYRGSAADPYGKTTMSAQAYVSPGGFTGVNNNTNFNSVRQGAVADYYYVRLDAERQTRLPWDFTLVGKGTFQFSDANLLPSEQMGLGGYSTIRGYEERLANGDEGYILNAEVWTPVIKTGNLLGKPEWKDTLQFLAFYDYGSVKFNTVTPGSSNANSNLSSVGGGLRYSVSRNFSLRFDYGIQLTERELSSRHSRGHLGAQLSF